MACSIVTVDRQLTAVVKATVPFAEIPKAQRSARGAVDAALPSELPAGRAAHFQLKGPFDSMPGAWQTLFDWCKAEKLDLAGVNWEIYMPWEGVDPAGLETDLYALLA
jgi:hypothetical protein